MTVEHGQYRAHKGHLSESLGNAIGDEISRLKSLWVKIEFERAFFARLTYVLHDVLRMFARTRRLILQPMPQFHMNGEVRPPVGGSS
jgi:hypothetical protein